MGVPDGAGGDLRHEAVVVLQMLHLGSGVQPADLQGRIFFEDPAQAGVRGTCDCASE